MTCTLGSKGLFVQEKYQRVTTPIAAIVDFPPAIGPVKLGRPVLVHVIIFYG